MNFSSTSLVSRLALPALCIFGVLRVDLSAEEWSRFRGPNGSGVAEASNLPATFDSTNTVWKIDVGKGWSSPVTWQGKVFITEETGPGKRAVVCLNMRDGHRLWAYDVPFAEHRKHNFNNFASSTPFVDADRVYVNWTSGDAVEAMALDHEGKLLWRKENLANYIHEHGSGASPVVSDGIMLVRAEFEAEKDGKPLGTAEQEGWKSCILGLDAATGEQKWKLEVPNTLNPYSTPIIRDLPGGAHEFIVANTTSGFMGLDTKKGTINWQHNPGYKQRSVGSIVMKDNVLFAALGAGDGGKESALIKLGGAKPEEIGSITKNIPYVPTPLLIGDRMYMLRDGGILTCLKYPTGETIYSERLTSAAPESASEGGKGKRKGGSSTKYFSSPVAADGKIYCCSQTGDVVVVKAGDQFQILGASSLDGPMNATPAIAANHLFIRTEKSIWCMGVKPTLP